MNKLLPILLLVLAACGTPEAVRIGVVAPLTGPAASYGEPSALALQVGADIINERGGILGRPVELVLQDGECNPAKAVTAAKHLIEVEGLSVLLAGSCSSESLAIAPVANDNKVLQVATITSADSYSDAGKYSFRVFPTSAFYIGKQAQLALQDGITSIVIIYEQKAYPQSVFTAFKNGFEAQGGMVVQEHAFPSEETDFRSYLLKAKESGAQAILFSAQGTSSAVNFLKHFHELNLQDRFKLIGNNVVVAKKVFDESQGLNAFVTAVDAYADRSTPQAQELLSRYAAKYGQEPQTNFGYVAASYDRLFLVAEAMEACGTTDTDCMSSHLSAVKGYRGVYGSLSFDDKGDVTSSIAIHHLDAEGNHVWQPIV